MINECVSSCLSITILQLHNNNNNPLPSHSIQINSNIAHLAAAPQPTPPSFHLNLLMMEQSSWDNWPLHPDGDFLEHCHTEDDDFLRDILQQPEFSSESESQCFHHHPSPIVHHHHHHHNNNNNLFTADEITAAAAAAPAEGKRPRTFILSFDNSTIIPATPEQPPIHQQQPGPTTAKRSSKSNNNLSSSSPKKRSLPDNSNNNDDDDQYQRTEAGGRSSQLGGGGKKARNDSQSVGHIMAERKRRQELTERFIALSATIPGLKKTDKASILGEAINYVKQLQERVTELEKRNKRGPESVIFLKKSDVCANNELVESSTSSETSNWEEECCRRSEESVLPDVEARALGKEVLVEIHCEKENGIELRVLDHLENLHLSVTATSVLPFGNSTLGITIIAQMGDAYRMTVDDLVKNIREVLLSHATAPNFDPY